MEDENKIKNPLECHKSSPEEMKELLQYYKPEQLTEFIRVGPKEYFFFKELEPMFGTIYNMEVRPSDTYVVTFPRSGTTWTQDMVWLLQNNLNFEEAKATPLIKRFPFLESPGFMNFKFVVNSPLNIDIDSFSDQSFYADPEKIRNAPSPRFLKTHLPMSLLPPALLDTAKVVYVARDPRDVAVSNYYHYRTFDMIPNGAPFKPFWDLFMKGKVPWSPFFEHIKEAWRLRNHPNMMFLFYEELSKDLASVAKRLAKFFGKEYAEEQIAALCNHLQFDNFRKNDSVNMSSIAKEGHSLSFIRKGKSGGWREHFNEEMTQQAERWISDNLRDTDLRFPQVD